MKIETKTIEKYYKALKELKTIVEYHPKLGLLPFTKKKGLSKNAATEIVKGGLLKNTGTTGRGASYVWNTIEPNHRMAEELIKRVNKIGSNSMRKSRDKNMTQNKLSTKENNKNTLETITVRLFFGLINITFKLNYK